MGANPFGFCYNRRADISFIIVTTARLEAEILKLPRSVRARLAERLISSLDEEDEIEKAWAEEADRRYNAFLNGEETMAPLEEVLDAIRKEFNL